MCRWELLELHENKRTNMGVYPHTAAHGWTHTGQMRLDLYTHGQPAMNGAQGSIWTLQQGPWGRIIGSGRWTQKLISAQNSHRCVHSIPTATCIASQRDAPRLTSTGAHNAAAHVTNTTVALHTGGPTGGAPPSSPPDLRAAQELGVSSAWSAVLALDESLPLWASGASSLNYGPGPHLWMPLLNCLMDLHNSMGSMALSTALPD